MKSLLLALLLMCVLIATTAQAETAPSRSNPPAAADQSVTSSVDAMKERMMNDQGIMQLITAMMNDPDMQAILNDPAIVKAVQSGDIATLLNNPAFMKLLDNPQVREIEQKMQQGGE